MTVPIPINRSKAVPILINYREAEIGAVPTTFIQKKIKVGAVPILINYREAEIGAVPTTFIQKKIKVGAEIGAAMVNLREKKS